MTAPLDRAGKGKARRVWITFCPFYGHFLGEFNTKAAATDRAEEHASSCQAANLDVVEFVEVLPPKPSKKKGKR